jgi:hypothetical protein
MNKKGTYVKIRIRKKLAKIIRDVLNAHPNQMYITYKEVQEISLKCFEAGVEDVADKVVEAKTGFFKDKERKELKGGIKNENRK